MYFKTITPFTESFSFTLKNFQDLFDIPADNIVKHTEEKLKRVETEFNKYYKYDDETESEILKAIGKIIKADQYDPIDIYKFERVFHFKVRLSSEERSLSKVDTAKFYTILYREVYVPQLPSYISKYTLLKIVGNRFIVFITFDEDEIEAVHTVIAENQDDLMSEILLEPLKINFKVFKKLQT